MRRSLALVAILIIASVLWLFFQSSRTARRSPLVGSIALTVTPIIPTIRSVTRTVTPVPSPTPILASASETPVPSVPITSTAVAWNPLARQDVDGDTTYLLDAEREQTYQPGLGGFSFGRSYQHIPPFSHTTTAPGRYRLGLTAPPRYVDDLTAEMTMPAEGLLDPSRFTVEFWMQAGADWNTFHAFIPVSIGSANTAVRVVVTNGLLQASYNGTTVADSFKSIPANTWHNVAVTYDGTVLVLYLDGARMSQAPAAAGPMIGDSGGDDGLALFESDSQAETTQATISDLRISRVPRVLNQPVAIDDANILTITATARLGTDLSVAPGSLFAGTYTAALGANPRAPAFARGVVTERADHLLDQTTVVAGVPTQSAPDLGHSGQYSYNWSVVDADATAVRAAGISWYVTFDYTPKILQSIAGDPYSTPTSDAAEATIMADILYHLEHDDGVTPAYVGIWNEPNGTADFWHNGVEGDPAIAPASQPLGTYLGLYGAAAPALRAIDPAVKIGGPEGPDFTGTYLSAFVRYCDRFNLPLDYVSWHFYSGDIGDIYRMRRFVDGLRAADGKGPLPLVVGEMDWALATALGGGPYGTLHYQINDWAATWLAQVLIAEQKMGVVANYFTFGVADLNEPSHFASGLTASTHAWAPLNTYVLWRMMAPHVVRSTYSGTPGVEAIATTDGKGTTTILVAYLKYRADIMPTVAISLPGLDPGSTVAHYIVDGQHADYLDTNGASSDIQQPIISILGNKALLFTACVRSVHLFVIHDPAIARR